MIILIDKMDKELKKLEKKWAKRDKERRAKEKQLRKEFEKTAKLIFKQSKTCMVVTFTATFLDRKNRKKVSGLSWNREELIKPRKKKGKNGKEE